MSYLRHNLCYLKKNTVPVLASAEINATTFLLSTAIFERWANNAYPLICTRQPHEINPSYVQLAIPYFDDANQQKHRFNFFIKKTDISSISMPPTLSEVFAYHSFDQYDSTRVFGSYAWQYLTNTKQVHHRSDLDVLIRYEQQSVYALLQQITYLKRVLNIEHIDAEVRFETHGDCALAELANSQANTILFKTGQGVSLVNRDLLYVDCPTLIAKCT